ATPGPSIGPVRSAGAAARGRRARRERRSPRPPIETPGRPSAANDHAHVRRPLYQNTMYLEGMVSGLSTTPLRKRGAAAPVEKLEDVAAFRSALRQYLNGTEAATAAAGLTPRRYDLLLMVEAANRAGKP